MTELDELKNLFIKEINNINKKIKSLSNKFHIINDVREEHEAILLDIDALDQRLLKLEKLNKVSNIENDIINNSFNNNIQNNIDDINNNKGLLFRSQVSTRSMSKKNKKINEKLNSKDKNVFYEYQPGINILEETKGNKKKEYNIKKSPNKNGKIGNINNSKNATYKEKHINEENNIKYLEDVEDIKNNTNSLIINNINDNFDIISFGKNDENKSLNNSFLTTNSKFSEFSFNPEKLNKIQKNNNKQKVIENINNIESNNEQIKLNTQINDNIINIVNDNLNKNFNNKVEDILNSEIIKDINEAKMIFNSLSDNNKFNGFPDIQTIFQSSLDGGLANAFHKFCDSEPNLIVLVETKNGERFGGYTKIGFSSDGETKEDDTIFIFNLDKMEIYKKFKKIYRFIYNDPNNGPCFGTKNNILFQISDNYLEKKSYIKEFFNNENEKFCEISIQNKEFVINKLEIFKILIN